MVLNKIMDKLKASLDAPIGSLLPEADTQIIQRTGWYQVVTPSVKEVSVNEVIFSLVDPAEVETRVNEAFEIYRRHGLPFKWCIGPMSSPEIEPRIGPVASASWLFRGMAIDTAQKVTLPDGIAVERVDGKNFDEFLTVFIQGWGLERFEGVVHRKLEIVLLPGARHRYYLARRAGEPMGVAGTVFKSGYGYLGGSVVLEKHRGAGGYRALVGARLRDLANEKFPLAVTQAREATSAPILDKLGFETTFKAKIFRFDEVSHG
jgi:hypothetical protein